MVQKINPLDNAEIEKSAEQVKTIHSISFIDKIQPSSVVANEVYFSQGDSCFYQCIPSDKAGKTYEWIQVTSGYRHQYVLPVAYITTDTPSLDDIVSTLNVIMAEMKFRYHEIFDPIDSGTVPGVAEEAIISKFNEIASYIEMMCDCTLNKASSGTSVANFVNLVNNLVSVVNPGAEAALFIKKLASYTTSNLTTSVISSVAKMCSDLSETKNINNGTVKNGYLWYNHEKYLIPAGYVTTDGHEAGIAGVASKQWYTGDTESAVIINVKQILSKNGWVIKLGNPFYARNLADNTFYMTPNAVN